MTNRKFEPVAWPAVLVAVLSGLSLTISRFNIEVLRPFMPATILVFVIPALAIPILWWRKREIPIWGLLPGGALAWLLVYYLGMGIAATLPGRMQSYGWIIMTCLQLALAAVMFTVLLRGRQLSRSVWISVGLAALVYTVALVLLAPIYPEKPRFLDNPAYFLAVLAGPAEGLFLVALGLLAARRHGVLAVLVILGGYVYMFTDSDYLFGYSLRDWAGLQLYLAVMTFLFLVVAPVGLMRARTAAGRAAGLFVPAILVLVARLVLPAMVVNLPMNRGGDVLISVTVLVSLALGWVLYGDMGDAPREVPANGPDPMLSPG